MTQKKIKIMRHVLAYRDLFSPRNEPIVFDAVKKTLYFEQKEEI